MWPERSQDLSPSLDILCCWDGWNSLDHWVRVYRSFSVPCFQSQDIIPDFIQSNRVVASLPFRREVTLRKKPKGMRFPVDPIIVMNGYSPSQFSQIIR